MIIKLIRKINKNKNIKIIYLLFFLILIYWEQLIIEQNWKNIQKDFLKLAMQYNYLLKNEENIREDSPIWIMWYQGINNAPSIIKVCIQSILLNRAKHPVIFLDKSNIKKYVKLPKYILKKYETGVFSVTHFSDIVRMALLSKHGGYWIDSTYLINTPLTYKNTSFFTLRLRYCDPSITKCLWSGNFLAMPKNSFLSTYAYHAFLLYWKKFNKLVNYFLIDYIIKIAYNNIDEFRILTEKIPYIECNIYNLSDVLNNEYEGKTPIQCPFNKLYRKRNYHEYKNGKKTNFKYIVDNYAFNQSIISNYI